jgi:hypothetical protein
MLPHQVEPGNPGKVDHVTQDSRHVVKLTYTRGTAKRTGFNYMPGFQPTQDNVLRVCLYNPPDMTLALGTTLKFIWNVLETSSW